MTSGCLSERRRHPMLSSPIYFWDQRTCFLIFSFIVQKVISVGLKPQQVQLSLSLLLLTHITEISETSRRHCPSVSGGECNVSVSATTLHCCQEGSPLTRVRPGPARTLDLTPDRANELYVNHVQTGHMVHPSSYSMRNEAYFLGGKAGCL